MELYKKYKELKDESNIFTFTGPICFEEVILLREFIEKYLLIQNVEPKQKRRIVNILIEALQNIQIHGSSDFNVLQSRGNDSFILFGQEGKSYVLLFGNFIKNSEVEKVHNKILHITNMDMQDLKQLYMETLDKGEITENGGASLGLIKMIMDSEKDSSFDFHNINEEYSFFTIKLRVA